ncbi:hypothetical protein [Brachybacterium paraconglomeratum]|uniref:hypothetical protein n=1 Tax=Brachybacterium paraconglomeratum TaxID=173362 RepID=UPI0022AE68D8|nr:hypothetical protein [Brachybacterium paraconglomeratum]MCZ4326774.1 hypothetical protein [Brachybacterium paraconglomeratum]
MEILDSPAEEWTAATRTGEASVATDGRVAVVVSLDGETVLAVMPHSRAVRTRPGQQGAPRGRGGAGRRHPTSMRELLELLRSHGFTIDRGTRHIRVSRGGETYTLPSTPSDHRSLLNCVKGLERTFGVALER